MHGLVMDRKHDEIVVPNPFAEAILFFRADAQGEEPPIRIIQGPRTYLKNPDTLAVDPEHGEVIVPARGGQNAILVFPREGNGNVAPLRIIHGPKTRLTSPHRVAVDAKNGLIVVANDRDPVGLLLFNRTDNGDVAPRAVISGPKTGIIRPQAVQVDPDRRLIFVALSDVNPMYQMNQQRQEAIGVGIWSYDDKGDVAPRFSIAGSDSMLVRPRGMALNSKDKELYVVDMKRNSLFTYFLPHVFED